MSILGTLKNKLLGKPRTGDYRQFGPYAFQRHRDLPDFTFQMIREMLKDSTVRLGLAMRAAPLMQAEIGYKDGDEFVRGVRADNEEVGVFLTKQLKRFWKHELHKLLTAQVWGWSAAEVVYRLKDGKIEVDRTLHRSAEDVIALTENGEVRGVKFSRVGAHGEVRLRVPQCYWYAYEPESESPYGLSALFGCYSAWGDKQLNGGAVDVRRTFMHKDAYGGMAISYPAETHHIQGDEKPNRDIAREMVEQYKAGGVVTLPSEVDRETGQKLWDIQYAHIPSNPQHILQYPKDLDVEILRGLEIPDDVLTSESTGAWAGKQVPMQAFYTNGDRWLSQVIQCLSEQIFEPLVMLNWGRAHSFQIEAKSLAEQAREQAEPQEAGTPVGPGAPNEQLGTQGLPGGEQPRRFGLENGSVAELLVGRGVVDAGELVEAGRKFMGNGGLRRLKTAHAPAGGVTVQGKKFEGGQFIPAEVMEEATEAEKAAVAGEGDGEAVGKKAKSESISPTKLELYGKPTQVKQEKGRWFFNRGTEKSLDDPGWTMASPGMVKLIENSRDKFRLEDQRERQGRLPLKESDGESRRTTRRTGPAIVSVSELDVDAPRFQYKVEDIGEGGVTGQFSDVEFNPELAGILYVWEDPETGKTFVVNGHHRYQLAKQSGFDGDLPVRFIDRDTAEEARAFGALINIAEGNGTALDAAKFMRDMGMTGQEGIDYFKKHNVSLKGAVAGDALKLANLSDNVFREMAFGRVSLPHAKAIGEELVPEGSQESREATWAVQNKLMKKIQASSRKLSEGVVREMAINASNAPRRQKESGGGLFDTGTEEEVLFEDRARIQAGVREALSKDVRGFGAVSNKGRADLLREGGVGDVSASRAGEKKSQAERLREAFDRETRLRGGIGEQLNRVLNRAAEAHNAATNRGDRQSAVQSAIAEVRGLLESAPSQAEIQEAKNTEWQNWTWRALPEDLDRYFERTSDSVEISLGQLTPIRAREKGIANGNRYMWLSSWGGNKKRKPIDVKDNGDGTYTVLDGNSTFANAKMSGWDSIVARVVSREKAERLARLALTAAMKGNRRDQMKVSDGFLKPFDRLTPEQLDKLAEDVAAVIGEDQELVAELGGAIGQQSIAMAAAHAPKGGVTIQGKPYKGGQFIPAEVMEEATEAEKAAVEDGDEDTEPGGIETEGAELKAKSLPRIDMPQLSGDAKNEFLRKLQKKGIEVQDKRIDPSELTGLQTEFDAEKVSGIAGAIKTGTLKETPILVTEDGYVLDGHHRWRAYHEAGEEVPVQEIGLTAAKAIDAMQKFEKTERKTVGGEAVSRMTGFGPKMAKFLHADLTPVMQQALDLGDFKNPVFKPQPFQSEEEVYAVAERNLDEYNRVLDFGKGVSADLGADVFAPTDKKAFKKVVADVKSGKQKGAFILLSPLKGQERARQKVEANYGGDWGQLRDVVRGTIAVDTFDEIPKAMDALRKNAKERGWRISVRPEDRFSNPTGAGYRDLQLFIESPDGLQAEVQIQTKPMFVAKETDGHKLYEEWRDMDAQQKRDGADDETQAKMTALDNEMKKLYATAWSNSGGPEDL